MCTRRCIEFARASLTEADVAAKDVLEVGSLDVNGSVRGIVDALGPARYVGVDIEAGPGVDEICRAEALVERFGEDSYDVVISTEVVEHVADWRPVVSNMKRVLRPGGVLVLTTRSRGFGFHGYPADFWRYETTDLAQIFGDLEIERLEPDSSEEPGAFVKARKPAGFRERDLAGYELYSIVRNRRLRALHPALVAAIRVATPAWYAVKRVLPRRAVDAIKAWSLRERRLR
jgi:SAM-dependent methyltransferase